MAKSQLHHQRDYSPVSWTEYFDEAHDIVLNDSNTLVKPEASSANASRDSFRVYLRNFRPPYAPNRSRNAAGLQNNIDMTEAEFSQYSKYPTIVLLHGGGYSALTWAQFTQHIEQECHCRLLSIDLRAHGDTKTNDDDRMDIETLVEDVIQVTHAAHRLAGFFRDTQTDFSWPQYGWCYRCESFDEMFRISTFLVGFVIIDVVEGTAKDALPLMLSVIKTRPTKFPSIKNAIEWCVRSGMGRNLDAARVSMPGNLLNISTGHLAIHDIEEDNCRVTKHKFHINIENLMHQKNHSMSALPRGLPLPPRVSALKSNTGDISMPKDIISGPAGLPSTLVVPEDPIEEISEEDDAEVNEESTSQRPHLSQVDSDGYKRPPSLDESGYCWRTDLARTQAYWPGWFEGLSKQLLDAPVQGKFLLLAGIDRLDKTLTIGQMQGKFMMKVLPKCGHAVHEDSPDRVASEIGQFLVRNKFTTAIVDSD